MTDILDSERRMDVAPPTGGDELRRRWPKAPSLDPLVALQVYIVVLVGSPSIYIIKPLGAAGTPATVLGCLLLVLWVVGRLTEVGVRFRPTPVHWFIGLFSVAMMAGFVAGMLRPISGVEVSSSERGLIMLASWAGVILLVADSMRTRARLDAFLRFVVLMGFILAAMGVIQFFWGVDFVSILHLPGLTQNSSWGGLYERSGFPRVSGTAVHSIEFAVVLGIILPVAIHLALQAQRRKAWQWVQLLVIAMALPLTVARSGALALVLGIVFAFIVCTKKQRIVLLLALPLLALVFRSVIPGLLGTIRELFEGASQDNSVGGRLRDYDAVAAFFSEAPWFGRGIFTFVPDVYRTLDNQFLGVLVEAGLVGLAAFALLLIGTMFTAFIAGMETNVRFLRVQALAVSAGVGTAFVLFLTFDAFGFPMAMGAFCLLVGAAGAVWRIHRQSDTPVGDQPTSVGRLTVVGFLTVALVLGAVGGAGALAIRQSQGGYEARGSLVLGVPQFADQNIYDNRINVPGLSDVLAYVMDSSEVRRSLAAEGVDDYTVAIGQGSLGAHTESVGSGEMMWVAVRAGTEQEASEGAKLVRDELEARLAALQTDPAIPAVLVVVAGDAFDEPEVFALPVQRTVALIGVAVAGVIVLAMLMALLTGPPFRRPAPNRGLPEPTPRRPEDPSSSRADGATPQAAGPRRTRSRASA